MPLPMTFHILKHDRGVIVIPLAAGYGRSRPLTCQAAA